MTDVTDAEVEAAARALQSYEYEYHPPRYLDMARAALTAAYQARQVSSETKYDDAMFNTGVTHVVELLSKILHVDGAWITGDGSEDYDADLAQTLINILEAKGLYDKEDGKFVVQQAVPAPSSVTNRAEAVATAITSMIAALTPPTASQEYIFRLRSELVAALAAIAKGDT